MRLAHSAALLLLALLPSSLAVQGGSGQGTLTNLEFMAQIHRAVGDGSTEFLCAGAIVSGNTDGNGRATIGTSAALSLFQGVITASECITGVAQTDLVVVVGRRTFGGTDGVQYGVGSIDTIGAVSLLASSSRMSTALPGGIRVQAITIASAETAITGTANAFLAGWGLTSASGSPANSIQRGFTEVSTPSADGTDAIDQTGAGNASPCTLDLGNPLYTLQTGSTGTFPVLHGVTIGTPCDKTAADTSTYANLNPTAESTLNAAVTSLMTTELSLAVRETNYCAKVTVEWGEDSYASSETKFSLSVGAKNLAFGDCCADTTLTDTETGAEGLVCVDSPNTPLTIQFTDSFGDGLSVCPANKAPCFGRVLVNGATMVYEAGNFGDSVSSTFVPRYYAIDRTTLADYIAGTANLDSVFPAVDTYIMFGAFMAHPDAFASTENALQVTLGGVDAASTTNHNGLSFQVDVGQDVSAVWSDSGVDFPIVGAETQTYLYYWWAGDFEETELPSQAAVTTGTLPTTSGTCVRRLDGASFNPISRTSTTTLQASQTARDAACPSPVVAASFPDLTIGSEEVLEA